MEQKDYINIAVNAGILVLGFANLCYIWKGYDISKHNNERITQLENTIQWMLKEDLELQKETD